ncbi:hypothetical protein F4777DRAFT_575384 [Nemania sp. FL0916]|nr:hypothetical protein F4777DRAFT_575384 [Nemania sp. FL0916]
MGLGSDGISGALALWVCNGLVAFLIFVRLGLRSWKKSAFTRGDGWLVVALVFNALRMVGDYYTNEYGNPLSIAMLAAVESPHQGQTTELKLTEQERKTLILAGKLMVAARVAIVVVLWSMKMAVLDMLDAFLRQLQCKRQMIWLMHTVLALTFIASILSVFLECQELKLNWTLFPHADRCSYDAVWIITYEISNIITDTLLFFLLVMLILGAPITMSQRIRLSVGGLGAVLITVEIVRLAEGLPFTDILLNRIVWGSIEVVIAASVATLPAIYMLLRAPRSEGAKESSRRATAVDQTFRASTIGPNASTDAKYRGKRLRKQTDHIEFPNIWDGTAPMDTDTYMLMPRDSLRSVIISSVSTEIGDRNSWPGCKPEIRSSYRKSRPCSGLSARWRGVDDNRNDDSGGWIELEETNTRTTAGRPSSPDLDDVEFRASGIFVATELKQEVHRVSEPDQRPRIVTIPRRAKLNHNPV